MLSRLCTVALLAFSAQSLEVRMRSAKSQLAAVTVASGAGNLDAGRDMSVAGNMMIGGATSEAQYSEMAMDALEATETTMTHVLRNITTLAAIDVIDSHGAPPEVEALIKSLAVRVSAKPKLAAVTVASGAGHLDAGHDMSVAANMMIGVATSEAQYTEMALGDLEATETSMTDVFRNITTLAAIDVIYAHGAPPEVTALIREHLVHNDTKVGQPGYGGVQKGQDMLNQMIQETLEKLDLEQQTCAAFIKAQTHQIWLTNQYIRMYDAAASGGRENILAAQTEIERLSKLLPQLQSTLAQHIRKCTADIAGLEAELKIVLGDIEVMSSILKLTKCSQALLSLSHVMLRRGAAKVSSPQTRQLLGDGLDEACTDKIPLEAPSDAFVQTSEIPLPATTTLAPAPDDTDDKAAARCTLSQNNCKRLRDKFLKIQSGITAKRDELMAELNMVKKHCDDEKNNMDSQISDAEGDLKTQQTNLAKATKEMNDAERNSKIKNEERVALEAEDLRMRALCKTNIGNLVSEKCALGKIRGELEQMKGHTNPAFLMDCEVSDWQAGECSKSCGGGVQKLTRAITVHPVGGAGCPPLEMERTCSEDPCPVDCVLQDWTEWGSCSAECNGGVKQKLRNVVTEPENGGAACGDTSVVESCNVQSCDEPCVLSDWTQWSVCSKECDAGLKSRGKTVMEKAKGKGECAATGHESRLEYEPCNEQLCNPGVTCASPLDVVLLLDGSSRAGQSGFEEMKKASEMFMNSLNGTLNRVSLILYSGPESFSQMFKCTGETKKGDTPPDMKKDCGIDVVQHFTNDIDAVVGKIKNLAYPGQSAMVSQALMAAKTELSLGRKDASSVVVVFANGRPMMFSRAEAAAKDVRLGARLMWVQVKNTNMPLRAVKNFVSQPPEENIIEVADYATLADQETIDQIVADVCPELNEPLPIKEEPTNE